MKYFVADFETTSFKQYQIDGETRVFMWSITDVETLKVVQRGLTIEEFFTWATKTRRDKTTTIYFHNLKFDGSFIVNYLLKKGYKPVKKFSEDCNNEFETLISEMGIWYGITLKIKKANYVIRINIRDSFKKIPLSVETIAETYNLPMSKGDFDYDMYRPLGYIPTDEEWSYVDRDTIIVAMAIREKLDKGMRKMTLGSDAYYNFKRRFSRKQFDYLFPILPLEDWQYIKKAYKGGWTYADKRYTGKVLHNVLSFDVNSLYPASMYNKPLPYGKPLYFTGKYTYDEQYPLYIQTIEVSFKLKENHLPQLQTSSLGHFTNDLFLTDTENNIVELTLTNLDLELFLEVHEVYYIKYLYGMKFKSHNHIFTEYIDEWAKIKEEAVGGERQIAKDMLCSLYGKFGTNPRNRDKIPTLNDDRLSFIFGEEYYSKWLKYIPIAVFTTAHARQVEIRTAQLFYDHFVYGDTDSIKLHNITLEDVKSKIHVDSKKLGAWKLDDQYETFKSLKAKHYAYTIQGDDELYIVASGLPKKAREDIKHIDDFKVGYQTNKKLIQRQVKGGAVLIPTIHIIK